MDGLQGKEEERERQALAARERAPPAREDSFGPGELGNLAAVANGDAVSPEPPGRTINQLEIIANEAIRATAGPTPFLYRYGFSSKNGATVVELDGDVELAGPAAVVPHLVRRAVKNGIDDNLATLKRILERGGAVETSGDGERGRRAHVSRCTLRTTSSVGFAQTPAKTPVSLPNSLC